MNPIQIKIQRLVDHELGHQERSELLLAIDTDSDLWQQLALAFIERQVMQESLLGCTRTTPTISELRSTQTLQQTPNSSLIENGHPTFEEQRWVNPVGQHDVDPHIAPTSNQGLKRRIRLFGKPWPSKWKALVAVSLLLAGILLSIRFASVFDDSNQSDRTGASQAEVTLPNQEQLTAAVNGNSIANASPSNSPATPDQLSLADAIARSTLPIPNRFRQQMLQAGYHVSENEETRRVALPIGGSVDIPIRTVKIEFMGLAAYQ